MYHVTGLKQTRGIKNVTLKVAKKIRGCRGLLGRVIPKDFLTFFIKRLIKVCAVPWNLQNLKLQNSTQRAPQRVLTCYAKRRIRR